MNEQEQMAREVETKALRNALADALLHVTHLGWSDLETDLLRLLDDVSRRQQQPGDAQ